MPSISTAMSQTKNHALDLDLSSDEDVSKGQGSQAPDSSDCSSAAVDQLPSTGGGLPGEHRVDMRAEAVAMARAELKMYKEVASAMTAQQV